jgi:hypothetical protein
MNVAARVGEPVLRNETAAEGVCSDVGRLVREDRDEVRRKTWPINQRRVNPAVR